VLARYADQALVLVNGPRHDFIIHISAGAKQGLKIAPLIRRQISQNIFGTM